MVHLKCFDPAYNEGVVIEDTLHAIAQQDYPAESYEVLLINDGSKDNTLEIAENLAKIYPCIKLSMYPKVWVVKVNQERLIILFPMPKVS